MPLLETVLSSWWTRGAAILASVTAIASNVRPVANFAWSVILWVLITFTGAPVVMWNHGPGGTDFHLHSKAKIFEGRLFTRTSPPSWAQVAYKSRDGAVTVAWGEVERSSDLKQTYTEWLRDCHSPEAGGFQRPPKYENKRTTFIVSCETRDKSTGYAFYREFMTLWDSSAVQYEMRYSIDPQSVAARPWNNVNASLQCSFEAGPAGHLRDVRKKCSGTPNPAEGNVTAN